MIKVTVTDSSGREREIEIGSDPKVLGRGEDSDIVLGSRSISRHHLRIWEDQGKVMVEDLTGGTGVTLEGEPVSGTFELEPGADMEAGVFVFHIPGARPTTSLDGQALGEKIPVPTLVGTKGPTKGLEVVLQEGDNDVGRDPGLYLVIDDPSVSRQHARLTVEAGRFTLIDLRSSNGTFVNNRRIDQNNIHSGDLVRFGNLEFRFLYGKAVSQDAARLKRKKLLMIGGGGLLGLLLIVGVSMKMCSPKPVPKAKPGTTGPTGPSIETQVEQLLRTADGLMEEGEWKAAIKELDQALDLHPICRECREKKTKVEEEIANKARFDQCVVDYDLNSWQKALDCFQKLPEGSYYEKKSKYKVSESINRLKRYHLGEGKGFYNANRYLEAHKHFVSYMALDRCDEQVFDKWLKKTEKKLKASYITKGWAPQEWNCETRKVAGETLDPIEEIKSRYRDSKLSSAMELYFKGKVDTAIHELQKIAGLDRDQGRVESAKELIRDLRVVKGKYADGISRLLRGNLKQAREQFDQAMVIDAKIMPKGVISFYRDDIGKQLAGKLHKEALGLFNRRHYLEAFEIWTECLQRNPAATDCQTGMGLLDGVGEEALEFARRVEAQGNLKRVVEILKHVIEITPEDRMSHKKARIWLNKIEEK
jgi:pSer/pThr/pTyr-binding forkhead associated (FHA) protein/tetratricopeptide (TPR) repeat protein